MIIRSVCKKLLVKNTLNFGKYKKKTNFWQKIHYYNTILLPFTVGTLSFYIIQNTKYFLTGLFCIHALSPLYIYLYILKKWDFKTWNFKFSKNHIYRFYKSMIFFVWSQCILQSSKIGMVNSINSWINKKKSETFGFSKISTIYNT
jgi:hypothetical protein